MAFSYQQILESQFERIATSMRTFQQSWKPGASPRTPTGSPTRRIASWSWTSSAWRWMARANTFVATSQPRGNQFGLSKDEVDIAHGISGGDASLTNEQRERVYAQNKQRLRVHEAERKL